MQASRGGMLGDTLASPVIVVTSLQNARVYIFIRSIGLQALRASMLMGILTTAAIFVKSLWVEVVIIICCTYFT